ncbi:hypothetical protein D3C87_1387370 [compost metagenome]
MPQHIVLVGLFLDGPAGLRAQLAVFLNELRDGHAGGFRRTPLNSHRPALRLDFGLERPADRLASCLAYLGAPLGADFYDSGHFVCLL